MTFGKNLITLREKAGISQGQLAENLNVSRQAVSKWERNGGMPDIGNLKNIADLFGVSIDGLLDHTVIHNPVVIREKIAISATSKPGSIRAGQDAAVRNIFPHAQAIYPLIRTKKMTKAETVPDVPEQPGVLPPADSLRVTGAYYLVEWNNRQLLVQVTNELLEGKELKCKFKGKKCVIDGNIFNKAAYTIKK